MRNLAKVIIIFPLFGISYVHAAPDASELEWKSITFGQSTDLNFGSTILPEKIGTNEVTSKGEVVSSGPLLDKFSIESRGGKLANSHEGGTFYYTELPVDINFSLSATLTLEQLGPETGATPNRQEGAGLMVRDVMGEPRANPQPLGHEEFPAASNIVMNLLHSHSRENDGLANGAAVYREGIEYPWGNAGNHLEKRDFAKGLIYGPDHHYRMTLTRSDESFSLTLDDGSNNYYETLDVTPASLIGVQDPEHQYIGFFAARNARVTVEDVALELSDANVSGELTSYHAPETPLIWSLASPSVASMEEYHLQAVANYAGKFSVKVAGEPLGEPQWVEAGEFFSVPLQVDEPVEATISYTPSEKVGTGTQKKTINIEPVVLADPFNVYVSPDGSPDHVGTRAHPLDITSAIEQVAPGGTIHLASGEYPETEIPLMASGRPQALKHLSGKGEDVRFSGMVSHNANYWKLSHIEVNGERLVVQGSHNVFEHIVTHSAPDTGFQISSPAGVGRALWASHNTVRHSESYNNMDSSRINADGFAAKMRIGDGNSFDYCVSHHNVDDGWDLFNKVEDGPNGVVTITNSIAFNNGRTLEVEQQGGNLGNGFKLGGEGLPVAHVVEGNLSFNNGMDGFTDNFNSGELVISNNVAIDNNRFNYIVRKSPYGNEVGEAVLSRNISLHVNNPSKYPDVVHGDIGDDNWFIMNLEGSGGSPFSDKKISKISEVIEKRPSSEGKWREYALRLRDLVF